MIKKVIKSFIQFGRKATDDSLTAYAAQTTFFVLLSFFPFVMLLIMIASKLSLAKTNVLYYLLDVVPGELDSYILYIVDDIMYSNTKSFTVITIFVSLWSAAKGIQALTYGLDKIYGVERKKNYFLTRLISALYTLAFIVLCIVIIVVHVFGSEIAGKVIAARPSLANATTLILSLKSAFTFLILFIFLLALYYQLPGRKGRIKHEVIGAALAALAWMLMTRFFTFYMRYVANDSYMYGSLTSIILILIWLYIGMNIVLYGAEINYYTSDFIEKRREISREKKNLKKEKNENESNAVG